MFNNIIDESFIRQRVPDREVWYFLLNYYPYNKQRVCNPLREDINPSAIFITDKHTGNIILYDFTDDKKWDSIEAIMYAHNVSKRDALLMIHNHDFPEFNIQNHEKMVYVPQRTWRFEIVRGNWTQDRLQYWQEYGVDKEILNELNIQYAKKVWGRHVDQCDYRLMNADCFAYKFDDRYKIYNPFNSDKKWLSNTTTSDIYGLNSLNDYETIIVTSSGKDTAALRGLFRRHGIKADVIAPQSEGAKIPQLSDFTNHRIIFWYDNDEAGISSAIRISAMYDATYVTQVTEYKDPSDWIKHQGDREIINFVRSWI